jgi:type 1 fimbriae regulatory protein FimE
MNTVVQLRPSQSEMPTVNQGRGSNETYRSREHLTESEIDDLIAIAGKGRNPERDRLLVMMAFRHALRVSELVSMKWDQIDLKAHTVFVKRVKGSVSGIHGLDGDELRLLRALRRDNPHGAFVFMSERKAPMSVDGAQKLIERLGVAAEMPFQIHAHMLRHSTGYALAGRGVDTRTIQTLMGHKNIQNTVIYTLVADKRVRTIWDR